MQIDRTYLIRLRTTLFWLHVFFDVYFFIFIVPTNIFWAEYFWGFNLWFAILVIVTNIPFGMRCPLTVGQNKVRQCLDPSYKPTHSALADFFQHLGITKNKLTLGWINSLVSVYVFFMVLSFIVTRS